MPVDIIVTIIAALAFAVGITGIVLPVLPGSFLILIGMLVWAIGIGGWTGWVAFALVAMFSIAGMASSYVLTGRKLKQSEVPTWAIFVAIGCAILGLFLIPGPGLLIGFILGFFFVELSRKREFHDALSSTLSTLKTLGIGILVELLLAMASGTAFIVALGIHLFSRAG